MIMKKNINIKIGIILITFILLLLVIGLFYTPYDINEMNHMETFQKPSFDHLLGTDNMGRDIFSRVMVGTRFTLFVAICTVLGSAIIGSILGILSGYIGGIIDELIMRVMDAVTSFPGILIALVMVSVLNYGQFTIIPALCIMFIPSFTRIMRTGTLQYKNSEFVDYVKVFGATGFRIMIVHILPNLFPSLLSSIIIGLSNAILAESSMSYLGLGIQPPTPSWGRMLYESQAFLFSSPWCSIAPGFMIMITVIGFHCLGEGIRKKYC
ncbi:MAG: ABC transporter permease [Lachnospiraceae bacterium]|nr:ABC transporter permease [Lachnospiraceae bacterium]